MTALDPAGAPPGMAVLERRYRKLLLAYPRTYRRAHGDELLDVLMESAAPGRRIPVLKEAWGLLAGGVRSRVAHQATGPAACWCWPRGGARRGSSPGGGGRRWWPSRGPAWMEDGTRYPISLSRVVVEVTAFGLAALADHVARDHRWAPPWACWPGSTRRCARRGWSRWTHSDERCG